MRFCINIDSRLVDDIRRELQEVGELSGTEDVVQFVEGAAWRELLERTRVRRTTRKAKERVHA